MRFRACLAAATILGPACPALAQQTSAPPPAPSTAAPPAPISTEPDDEDLSTFQQVAGQIVVIAGRIKGQVEAPQAPLLELDEQDIAAYGATSISDLLDQLSPVTSSGRGRGSGPPAILLNGQRISSFREMRDFPPEAIKRVEVLPEEVALRFGFPPDQRVVNIILKDTFRSKNVGVEYGVPTQGGFHTTELEATLSRIDHGARTNIKAKYNGTSPLTEAGRGIPTVTSGAPTVAGDPDPSAWNTLISGNRTYSLNANWAKGLGKNGLGGQISLNGALTRADTRSLNGLNTVVLTSGGASETRTTLEPRPLTTRSHVTTAQAGASLNLPLGEWQFSATADYTHTDTRSTIDNRADLSGLQALVDNASLAIGGSLPSSAIVAVAPDRALSNTDAATSLVTLTGRPLSLPGGDATLTLKTGYAYSDITSSDTRTAGGGARLRRGEVQAGFNLAVPVTSRRNAFGAALGDVSLNFNGSVHGLSDFGRLYNYGAGLTWGLTRKLTLTASYIAEDHAPGLADLGGPVSLTPGVAIYDFSTGKTVLASVVTGGNAALLKEKQRDWKLGLTWNLPFFDRSNLLVEYFRNHSTNTTNAFPLLTPAVEAAFPGRVVRDASGQIVSVDERPVTFADERSSSLRYGFNVGGQFGKAASEDMGGRGGRGGPGFGPGRMGNGKGRWNLSIYHTLRFSQTAQLSSGGPVLDLLGGDAISGSVARNAVTMEGGGFYRGFGLRLSGTFTGPSHIDASGLPGSTRLDFAPIATFDMRLFVDFNQKQKLTRAIPFLKNARMLFKVTNLFDAQQKVTDGTGATPLRYLPGYEDPQGRVIGIDFRKRF
ncbi:MAG: TonB-dependent receptor plug domain-containing protein [Sphingomonadales bacterium]|nr:TonB-dependent receptor plug domain-containing protein [Sphingomonadales bacterium]MDE2567654.1 TonB-dependent receptor plug domain-containing protein [Sphingomonadales bacterium]